MSARDGGDGPGGGASNYIAGGHIVSQGGGGPGVSGGYSVGRTIDSRTGLEIGGERWLLTEILSELRAIKKIIEEKRP